MLAALHLRAADGCGRMRSFLPHSTQAAAAAKKAAALAAARALAEEEAEDPRLEQLRCELQARSGLPGFALPRLSLSSLGLAFVC